ncbi:MAG: hypothetical protein HYW89_04555 [Candidatus Sungiibacteriota bacterium]|uniref:Uncharacterized protein n=1 Tax=Candidatus Sungiibacteriota bacterium TaxID=2750080 RepID=A0A7T5RJF7_9BACT|nr:MAG: hypothetical protein HYW89_04555 [Candidatus Sungbacteria bacterium]
MRIFFICKVRGVTEDSEEYQRQKAYVEEWERQGHEVHWPHRNTEQKDPKHGTGICRTTFWAIFWSDEVRVLFDPTSEGFIADMMMTFALKELGNNNLFKRFVGRRKVVVMNPEALERKIAEEIEQQIIKGADPLFVKSYAMVLQDFARETASF